MTLAVLILIIATAFLTDRHGGVDEIGLFNPTYMDLKYGRITYPVHGYFNEMVVHPPVHYKIIAALMRAGLSLYYAQATPTVVFLLLCVWLLVTSRWPWPLKVGFLFGIWTSYAIFLLFQIELFGMRPEGHLEAAWLAGLLALESARLEQWSRAKLFLGAFLVTYAAGLHYYAAVAVLACVVYAACAVHRLGWRRSGPALLMIAAGGLLYGIPYIALWAWPQHEAIFAMIRRTRAGGGVSEALHEHVSMYRFWSSQGVGLAWLRLPISLSLPVVAVSTPILLALRTTRVFALAALPVQVFLLLFAWHKHGYYVTHEMAIYSGAVAAGILTIVRLGMSKMPGPWSRSLTGMAAVLFFVVNLWSMTDRVGGVRLSGKPRVHESEVARAAAREVLGGHAHVASRIGLWYACGAVDWSDPAPALLWSARPSKDPAAYFAQFDAIAEHRHMSDSTSNAEGKVLASWYLSSVLKLRGFFFADANPDLSYLLFDTKGQAPVTGFGLHQDRLYRFDPGPGDYEFAAIAGPDDRAMAEFRLHSRFHNTMTLPRGEVLFTVVVPWREAGSYEKLLPHARVFQRIRGSLTVADKDALVGKLRREDPPIRFHPPL